MTFVILDAKELVHRHFDINNTVPERIFIDPSNIKVGYGV